MSQHVDSLRPRVATKSLRPAIFESLRGRRKYSWPLSDRTRGESSSLSLAPRSFLSYFSFAFLFSSLPSFFFSTSLFLFLSRLLFDSCRLVFLFFPPRGSRLIISSKIHRRVFPSPRDYAPSRRNERSGSCLFLVNVVTLLKPLRLIVISRLREL